MYAPFNFGRRPRSPIRQPSSFLALALAFLLPAFASAQTEPTARDDGWVKRNEVLTLELDHLPSPEEGRIHVMVGTQDMTAMSTPFRPNLLKIDPSVVPLPQGETEVILYLSKDGGEWAEFARFPLKVLAPGGFEEAEWLPNLSSVIASRLDTDSATAEADPRGATTHDATFQAGLSGHHVRQDLDISSDFNVFGTSNRTLALRFDEKGSDASKIDLSDYLVELQKGPWLVSLGHVQYGNNPLLLDNMATRGIVASNQINTRIDVSASFMSATEVTGADNLFGLNSSDNNISATTIGVELLRERPGGLRVEATYMTGSRQETNYSYVGEVPESEESRGLGLQMSGESESGRLRGRVIYARSTFENPPDPTIAQGDAIVEVESETDNARHVDVSYTLLQNKPLSEQTTLNLTLMFNHDQVGASYRSLGADAPSNLSRNAVGLDAQIGDISLRLDREETADNLDDLPNVLETKTERTTLNLGVPLPTVLGGTEEPSIWWPFVGITVQRVDTFAGNRPDPAQSGFSPSDLPDEVDTTSSLDLNWPLDRWTYGYRYSRSEQDNRQVGAERDDTITRENAFMLGFRSDGGFSTGISYSMVTETDRMQGLKQDTDNVLINAEVPVTKTISISADYSDTQESDSANRRKSVNRLLGLELNWSFALKVSGEKAPSKFFLRYEAQRNKIRDNVFATDISERTWAVTSGLSISFF